MPTDRPHSIKHTKSHLSAIVTEVAENGTHYRLGAPSRPARAIIVPASHAIPTSAWEPALMAIADTCAATINAHQALPEGITDLLTWWASLTPTPTDLPLFLSNVVRCVQTQDDDLTRTAAEHRARDTITAYTGWSRHDWDTYLSPAT